MNINDYFYLLKGWEGNIPIYQRITGSVLVIISK